MNALRLDNLSDAQSKRLRRFNVAACVDIHCHVLPGLDDGPATLEDSLALCRALADDGTTTVIATPHQLGRYEGQNHSDQVRQAVSELNQHLVQNAIPLWVLPGGDVRLDERIPEFLRADQILTLGDAGTFVLLELAHNILFDIRSLISELASQNINVIISHPERNDLLIRDPERIIPWVRQGVTLQITAASLLGELGPPVERAAWQLLNLDRLAIVACDAHNLNRRPPRMTQAFDAIERYLGPNTARRVCIDNPLRILSNPNPALSAEEKEKGVLR